MTVLLSPGHPVCLKLADGIAASRRELDDALPSGVDGVVIMVGADPIPEQKLVTDVSPGQWRDIVSRMMWRALTALQRSLAAMPNGGRIVVVVPTVGMAGAAGLVPYTTAVEGIRAMTKSAARQWHSAGVAVNLVAVPLRFFAPSLAVAEAHLTAAAVDNDETFLHTLTETIKFLLRGDIDHLAGITVVADGGSVMLP